jgi:hypothetical protein
MNFHATVQPTTVTFFWNAVEGAQSYELQTTDAALNNWEFHAVFPGNATQFPVGIPQSGKLSPGSVTLCRLRAQA